MHGLEPVWRWSRHKAATGASVCKQTPNVKEADYMQIRIYETDFEGHPVECTGEYFSGPTALAIVDAMKMDPFNAGLAPAVFMRQLLDSIGQKNCPLAEDPEKAAVAFLQRLTALGYAAYILEPHELIEIQRKKCDVADFEKSKQHLENKRII